MASRNKFWGGKDSSSSESEESSYDSDSSGSSDSEKAPRRNFLDTISSSSEEEERVVKSPRTKANEALSEVVGVLKTALGDLQWTVVAAQWDKLIALESRLTKVLSRLPRAFVATLCKVEDAVRRTTKADLDKLDGRERKAFNVMQQRLRKLAGFEAVMAEFRAAPDQASESEPDEQEDSDEQSADSDDDSDDGDGKKKTKKNKTAKKGADKRDGNDEQPEPSVDEIDAKISQFFGVTKQRHTNSRKQMFELLALKKKATTTAQHFKILIALLSIQFDRYNSLDSVIPDSSWKRLALQVVALLDMMDAHPELSDSLLIDAAGGGDTTTEEAPVGSQRILAFTERLGDSLLRSFQDTDPHSSKYLALMRTESRYCTLCIRVQRYYESRMDFASLSRVILRHVDLLYYKRDEFDTAPLPLVAPSSTASTAAADDNEDDDDDDDDDDDNDDNDDDGNNNNKKKKKASNKNNAPAVRELPVEPGTPSISERLRLLAKVVYEHGTPTDKTTVLLMDVYHHALHDRYTLAKDMMLMSHIQDTVHTMDVNVQILFNRAMVQLGLAAFRQGLIEDAHSCLMDLYSSPRPAHKELLAQGLSKVRFPNERPPERESQEKRRQIPYHKHISLEVVECVHLICALLLEVPSLAAHQFDVKYKSLSRSFSRLIEMSEKQIWGVGPAESSRDHIIAAARKLNKGDWQSAASTLLQLSCWRHVRNPDALKAMLLRKIQESALRTYIFSYAAYYDSMSVEKLGLLFQLPQDDVHRLLSKMIIDGELHASHHQPTNSIVLHRVEPTRLHSLALQFAEKASALVEQSDKTSDTRQFSSYPYSTSFDNASRRQQSAGSKQRGTGQSFRGSSRGSSSARGQDNNRRGSRGRGTTSARRS